MLGNILAQRASEKESSTWLNWAITAGSTLEAVNFLLPSSSERKDKVLLIRRTGQDRTPSPFFASRAGMGERHDLPDGGGSRYSGQRGAGLARARAGKST